MGRKHRSYNRLVRQMQKCPDKPGAIRVDCPVDAVQRVQRAVCRKTICVVILCVCVAVL